LNRDTHILITGATGFVGSYVLRRLLKAGYTKLYGLRREGSSLDLLAEAADRISWRTADITDYFGVEDALENIEVVIHCAALVSFQGADKERLLEVNRGGTRNVVNAALYHGVKHLYYLSSVAALGRHNPGELVAENSKWEDDVNISQYSRSKFLAELEVWRGQAEGLAVGLLYPSVILGAGRWKEGSVRILDYAAQGMKYYPKGTTGIVDVRDVAEAMFLLLERAEDGDRFLLNGSNVSYKELLWQMARALGNEPPQKELPFVWARWLARLEAIRSWLRSKPPLLTRETVHATYQQVVYDSSKSESVLGLSYHSLEDTIEDAVAVYQQTHQDGFGVLAFR